MNDLREYLYKAVTDAREVYEECSAYSRQGLTEEFRYQITSLRESICDLYEQLCFIRGYYEKDAREKALMRERCKDDSESMEEDVYD